MKRALFENDFKIVENKKKVALVPILIIIVAIIAGVIYNAVLGSAFNLGMDFTGGYVINIELGDKLTDDNYDSYKKKAVDIAENLADDEGNVYGIKISAVQRQISVSESSNGGGIRLEYQAVADEDKMLEINEQLKDEYEKQMFYVEPVVTLGTETGTFTATYPDSFTESLVGFESDRIAKLSAAGYALASNITISNDGKSFVVKLTSAVTTGDIAALTEAMTLDDGYSGEVTLPDQTGAAVSDETLKTTMLGIFVSLCLMLVYIVFRFTLISGISAIVALLHDLIIMMCGMVIFHIEINATFIAALITILGYSINNTIIIFDRVRENLRLYRGKRINGKLVKSDYIANKSVQETIWRSINTTLTTLLTIATIAIFGVSDIQVFALPIIFGLLAGTYSSVLIAPTIWAMLEKHFPEKIKAKKNKVGKRDTI